MNLKLSAKLYAATTGAIAIMLVLVAVGIYGNRASQKALGEVFDQTVKPLLAAQSIERQLQEVRFRVAAVTLGQTSVTGSRNHLKEVRDSVPEQWNTFSRNNRSDSAEEEELIRKIDASLKNLPQLLEKIDKAYAADDRKMLEALMEEDWPPVTKQTVRPLAELIAIQSKQMAETYTRSVNLAEKLNATSLTTFIAGLILLTLGALVVVRSIAHPIREVQTVLAEVAKGDLTVHARTTSRDEIGAMATSLNETVEALNLTMGGVRQAAERLTSAASTLSAEAGTAREETSMQTDRVMEISAAMEQLTVSVAEIAGRAKDVARASEETRSIARASAEAVDDNSSTTRRALEAVASSGTAVGELTTEIDKISAITQVIKEIADQTNLLALNAAIEAARAGESGRGFAVVADEVRKLAERTTTSTVDITRMIGAIQAKALAAVAAMEAVSTDVQRGAEQTARLNQSFDQILKASERLSQIAGEIADGTTAQTQVAQQTARSMEVIAQASERTGGSVEHVASAATESAATAQNLKALVDRFRVT